jgi:hypothetical protein
MEYFDPSFRIDGLIDKSLITTVRAKIRAWITSPWLTDLVTMFDGEKTFQGNLDEFLEALELFSDRWDFRRIARERGLLSDEKLRHELGSARWLSASTGLPEYMDARILKAAKQLGLVESQPPAQLSYDYIVVLGGARLSCQLRPLLAADIIRSGVHANKIALLGSARPVTDSERDATDTYAPGAVDEFDLIVAGAQEQFALERSTFHEDRNDDQDQPNLRWIVRRYQTSFDRRPFDILAISAPSSDPAHRRANSADTIRFLLDKENVQPGNRLLLITSQIYVPYVQLEALRTVALPAKVFVETIGFPSDRMPLLQGLSNPNHYLQEIRSAIQAARRFCQTYAE